MKILKKATRILLNLRALITRAGFRCYRCVFYLQERGNVPPQVLDLGVFPKGTQEPNYQFLGQLAKFSQGPMMLVSGQERKVAISSLPSVGYCINVPEVTLERGELSFPGCCVFRPARSH